MDADAQRAVVLDAERRLLRVAEREVLWRTAKTAASERESVNAVVLGLEVDKARFEPLLEPLSHSDDPDVLDTLAHRVDAERYGERAEALAVRARYRPGGPGIARWPGVDRARGKAVLDGVTREYVTDVPADRMAAAVTRRYAALWAVHDAFPQWERAPTGSSVVALIEDAVAAGLPEPVAVAEGVEAALSALDPYTVPVWPGELARWKEHHAGASLGVGVELANGPDGTVVVALPTVGGPAWRGGVHAADRVVRVGDTAAENPGQVAYLLGGEAGTTVALTVDRAGTERAFSLVREEVPEETVTGWRRTSEGWDPWVAPGIAWIHVRAFRPHTDEELDAILAGPARAVVLDLRGNPGGDVMSAVELADRFVPDGELAWLGGRTIAAPKAGANGELPWNVAIPGQALEGVAVVLLVDGRTASAAELVAGALRERAGAKLVGDKTFGKGLAQALRVDEALGVGWQVTNGTWMTPSHLALEGPGGVRTGLVPDVAIPLSPAERLQADAMRRARELPPAHPDGSPVLDVGLVARSDLPRLSDDPQAVEALRLARAAAR
jgi:carboxyl-terminal processing protease